MAKREPTLGKLYEELAGIAKGPPNRTVSYEWQRHGFDVSSWETLVPEDWKILDEASKKIKSVGQDLPVMVRRRLRYDMGSGRITIRLENERMSEAIYGTPFTVIGQIMAGFKRSEGLSKGEALVESVDFVDKVESALMVTQRDLGQQIEKAWANWEEIVSQHGLKLSPGRDEHERRIEEKT